MPKYKTIQVNITQTDIDNGIPCNSFACPVRRAIARHVKDPIGCTVQLLDFYIGAIGMSDSFRLPQRIIHWIRMYDKGRKVEPTSFTFELPKKYLK